MDGLLEFTFEDVSPEHFTQMVLDNIGEDENILDAAQDSNPFPIELIRDSHHLANIAGSVNNISCNINLKKLKIAEKSVKNVTLRIVHYSCVTDVSMLCTSTDCKDANISTAIELYNWAVDICQKYGVNNFYGGLEPADDEDTQLFSKGGVGPILEI